MKLRKNNFGVTLIELLIVIAIIATLLIPILITYGNSRRNQALKISAERFSTLVTTAHIYAREAKGVTAWGVVRETPTTYALVSGIPGTYDIEIRSATEQQVSFTDDFTIWFDLGTGETDKTHTLYLESGGKQTEIVVETTGVVEIKTL